MTRLQAFRNIGYNLGCAWKCRLHCLLYSNVLYTTQGKIIQSEGILLEHLDNIVTAYYGMLFKIVFSVYPPVNMFLSMNIYIHTCIDLHRSFWNGCRQYLNAFRGAAGDSMTVIVEMQLDDIIK